MSLCCRREPGGPLSAQVAIMEGQVTSPQHGLDHLWARGKPLTYGLRKAHLQILDFRFTVSSFIVLCVRRNVQPLRLDCLGLNSRQSLLSLACLLICRIPCTRLGGRLAHQCQGLRTECGRCSGTSRVFPWCCAGPHPVLTAGPSVGLEKNQDNPKPFQHIP